MALLLNIETSAQVCSVCLSKDGKVIEMRENQDGKSHATSLTPYIEEIFNSCEYTLKDIDAVVISKGPGSYTGLRIGVSTAKGICYALNKPLIAINTLKSVCNGLIQNNDLDKKALFVPLIDARRMEVYSAIFDFDLNEKREIKAEIIDENSFDEFLTDQKVYMFGDGAEKCKNIIHHENAEFVDDILPSSAYLIELAELAFKQKDFVDVAYFEPFYLKDFIATIPKKKLL